MQASWQGTQGEEQGNAVGTGSFFSAMTPWETTNVLLSMLVSSEVPDSNKADDEELEMGVSEIFRAYFMAPSARGRRRDWNPVEIDVWVQNGECGLAKRLAEDNRRGW